MATAFVLQVVFRHYFKNKCEREESQKSIVVVSRNPQPTTATTTVHASRFVARILHANQRRKKGKGSNVEIGPNNNNA